MIHKKLLLCLMVGLLAMSFAVPATAADRPAYALDPNEVPGWWLFGEGQVFNWTANYGGNDFSMNAWYQIWINNQSSFSTKGEAWLNATAGMLLVVVDFGQPVDKFKIELGPISITVNLWDLFVKSPLWSWFNASAQEKSIPGLTKAFAWHGTTLFPNIWIGLGYTGQYVILALGKGDESPPGNIFGGGLAAVKAPTSTGASQANILTLMGAQGTAFPSGIPGFTVAPLLIAMVVLFAIIYLLRKDQLHLLK